MKPPRAIEIVGGGLAGLSLGLALRRAGTPVLLFEAGNYPRHRVCGEFIAGLESTTIERLGLGPALRGALRHEEVAWSIPPARPRMQRLPAPALGISRHTLDERLAREFVASGGELHARTRVTEENARPGRVFATGRRPAPRSRWIGLKLHVDGLALTRDLEMHLGAHCYVGLTRVAAERVNVCGLFRRRQVTGHGPELLCRYLQEAGLEELGARISRADVIPESFCAVAALAFDGRVPASTRVCLGDANAMIAPFTGNGMAMAFQSAEVALAPLLAYSRHEADWRATVLATQAALRRRFRVRLVAARALHPFLLQPRRQHWLSVLNRARLVPFAPLYASLH